MLPPDVREWLPENLLIGTSRFFAANRDDGHRRAAYEPSMMIALLLYCWARDIRSARAPPSAAGKLQPRAPGQKQKPPRLTSAISVWMKPILATGERLRPPPPPRAGGSRSTGRRGDARRTATSRSS
jgi:hypothetical protein